jgi:hypothetical protein
MPANDVEKDRMYWHFGPIKRCRKILRFVCCEFTSNIINLWCFTLTHSGSDRFKSLPELITLLRFFASSSANPSTRRYNAFNQTTSASFYIRTFHFTFIVPFDAMQAEILRVSLNKLHINNPPKNPLWGCRGINLAIVLNCGWHALRFNGTSHSNRTSHKSHVWGAHTTAISCGFIKVILSQGWEESNCTNCTRSLFT